MASDPVSNTTSQCSDTGERYWFQNEPVSSVAGPTQITGLELSGFDLDMVRQWFNAVQDTAPRYLEQRDFELAARVHQALGLPIPLSVARHLEGAKTHG